MTRGAPSAPEPSSPDSGSEEGDRSSVTDVNGSVARFEMTYAPPAAERTKFGPPMKTRFPSALYFAASVVLGGLVLFAYTAAATSSWLFRWVVEGDRGRPLPASALAIVVIVSAVGTMLRTHMRGVILGDDGIEARYLLPFGIPRTRKWAWTQVNRVIMDETRIALELWDGTYERLPPVGKARELAQTLQQHARRRKIDVTVLGATRP